MARTKTLTEIAKEIPRCRKCPRLIRHCTQVAAKRKREFKDFEYWGKPVPGFGDAEARLWIVGLAPAAHGANRTGRMFTGDSSGNWLYRALHLAGFANQPTSTTRDDGLELKGAFVSSAGRCAPPDNKPTPDEIVNCLPHLVAEVAALPNLRAVVALGSIGYDAYLRLLRFQGLTVSPRPAFGHGSRHRLPNGITLIGCYHPSRQNTNTGRLTARMMAAVFRQVRRELNGN